MGTNLVLVRGGVVFSTKTCIFCHLQISLIIVVGSLCIRLTFCGVFLYLYKSDMLLIVFILE
jgi:hypothetical protein